MGKATLFHILTSVMQGIICIQNLFKETNFILVLTFLYIHQKATVSKKEHWLLATAIYSNFDVMAYNGPSIEIKATHKSIKLHSIQHLRAPGV